MQSSPPPATPVTPPSAQPEVSKLPSANSPKILVVDDNPVILKTLSLKLKSASYQVCTALEGAEAVSAVRKEKPDLILLDISFPPDVSFGGSISWDGFSIMDWLRRTEEARTIPIIVITGGDPAKYEAPARAAGAVAFFQKPINHEALLKVIQRVLKEKAKPSAAASDTAANI